MRFVEPFKHAPNLTDNEQLEKERLMFMELTQSMCLLLLSSHVSF